MAPNNKKGNGPGRGGKGKTTSFPEMPKHNQSSEADAQNGLDIEAHQSAQENEIFAIEQGYWDCFIRKEAKKTAWKQQEAAFEVILTSTPLPDDPSMSFTLTVNVILPAAYPRTAPKIELDLDKALHRTYENSMKQTVDQLIERMIKKVDTEPQIVSEVLQELQQELDKAAANKAEGAKLPSLEEQRAMQAANLETKKAQEQAEKEEEERQKQQAERAKNKILARSARFEASQSTPRPSKSHALSSEMIAPRDSLKQEFVLDFGKVLKVDDINRVEHKVHRIKQHQFYARGPVSDCYKVVPDMPVLPYQFLIVKRSRIKAPAPETGTATATATATGDEITVDTLENNIQDAMAIGQGSRHIVQIHAFDIRRVLEEETSFWNLEILMEHGSMGSLRQFIISAQELTSNRACELGLEILEGLAYLHGNGVVHRDLHASNILLVRTINGNVVAKIADINFQDTVHRMTGVPSYNQLGGKVNSSWTPAELLDKKSGSYTEKTDIWFYGIILLQMLFGLDFMGLFFDVNNLFAEGSTSQSLQELLSRIFQRKPKHRTRAMELKGYSYFTDNNAASDTPRRRNSSISAAHPSMSLYPDRFAQEFVVLSKLGKGAFGEVLKARKRLDGQEYAVKKIKESDDMTFDEIVREVQSLSSLQSIYIVRYYNAWIQKVPIPAGVRRFTNDETDSDISRTIAHRSKVQISKYGQSTGLSQSLDWVAKKSPLSRRMSSEGAIDEETETEDEDESDSETVERNHDSDAAEADEDEDEDESDETDEEEKSDMPTGVSNVNFDSNPFGYDSHDLQDNRTNVGRNEQAITDSDEEEDTDYDHNGAYSRTLYIQMELCDGNLRTAINSEGLQDDPKEIARLLRQILEGLKYIHSKNQIHRDLKPENIFFDSKSRTLRTVRIGDFGLAAMGARQRLAGAQPEDDKMTGNIGTAYYVAPEVKDGDHYGAKADMYSLGIILFELCYHPLEGMERSVVLNKLRQPNPELPEDFNTTKIGGLDKIILKLLNHNQNERPTAEEVLASGELPDSVGIEVIQGAMSHLTDPKSVFHREVIEAILSRPQGDDEARIKSLAWNLNNTEKPLDPCHMVMRCIVKDELTRLFRHHGALDIPRPVIFPITAENDSFEIARVLGPDGTILQLRYDLTIPLARSVATIAPKLEKFNAFGGTLKFYAIDDVYRQKGVATISSSGEAAFDIISDGHDLSIKEAEVMKVLEEITSTFPCLAGENICFNVNHSDILTLIFDHCGVQTEHRDVAIDNLAQLSVATITWQQVERALAAEGLSKTSVMKLQDFIFREHPEPAFSKMQALLKDDTDLVARLAQAISHIQEVLHYLDLLGVKSKILIAPLGCAKEKVCRGGLTFSCQIEDTRELLAAGGRYDSLLSKFAQQDKAEPKLSHAVGFGLGWDTLTAKMYIFYHDALKTKKGKRASEDDVSGIWRAKRCDVLVCSYDKNLLRNEALSLLNDLWVNGISAELACGARQPEDISKAYKEDSHYWSVTIKQDKSVKIRTIGHDVVKNGDMKQKKNAAGDCTVAANEVVSKLKALIRERESSGHGSGHAVITKRHDQMLTAGGESHITVVNSDNKNRKGKNMNDRVRSNVQTASISMLQQMVRDVQTFSVDLPNDNELEKIQDIPLTSESKWKELTQRSYTGEVRSRLQNLYNELIEYKGIYKAQHRPRHVILYNPRTGNTFLYDVGLCTLT